MKLKNVAQVVTTYDDEIANKFLNHGWKLLYVTSMSGTDDRYVDRGVFQSSEPCFILGATNKVAKTYSRSEGLT